MRSLSQPKRGHENQRFHQTLLAATGALTSTVSNSAAQPFCFACSTSLAYSASLSGRRRLRIEMIQIDAPVSDDHHQPRLGSEGCGSVRSPEAAIGLGTTRVGVGVVDVVADRRNTAEYTNDV